ncbi:PEGA domain-containing protein [Candidatus Woesearchaeota archaeon]|nr:PEGA domain-containing protein [Candidatus Woesearchaeota archaeon]
MNKDLKIFLALFLVLSVGFISTKVNITGEFHGGVREIPETPIQITVTSDPDGANVYINDNFIGTTPVILKNPVPVTYEIVLKKIGYYDLKKTISLEEGLVKEVRLEMTKTGYGLLDIDSKVKAADIYINNELKGIIPKTLSLKEGSYEIKVSSKGYMDFFTRKSIKSGQKLNVFAELDTKEHGSLYIETQPSDVRIYANDVYLGRTPSTITLEKGLYLIKAEKEGYESREFDVQVQDNKREELIFELSPSLGTLLVSSNPSGASIYIDGEYKGMTPKVVTNLDDGFHSLKLSKEYYQDYTSTFEVKRLYPNNVLAELERK